jgi:leucyl aminopeptidase
VEVPALLLDTQVVPARPASHSCDVLAVLVPEGAASGAKISDPHLSEIDRALSGILREVAGQEEFTGKEGQTLSLHTHGKIAPARVVAVGLGKSRDEDQARDALRIAAARAVKVAKGAGAKTLAIAWPQRDAERDVQALAEGACLGAYSFDRYK